MKRFLPLIPLSKLVRSPEWAKASIIALGVFSTMYAINALFFEVNPGKGWGLTYGWVAAVLMFGAGLYAARRRMFHRDLGRSKVWVQFHLYGGTLGAVLVLFHTGFSLPNGVFNWLLWGLAVWITLSGFLGLALQRWIPRLLTSGLSVEAVYERIPELVQQLRERAEKLVASCAAPIKDFYRSHVAAALVAPQPRLIYYLDVTGGIQSRVRQFDFLRRVLPTEEKSKLDEIQLIFRTKLELDAHYSLQRALRWWLYTHVPLSFVLLLMILLHIWAVWYY
ncbi:MAG: hypothetical protein C4326_08715 [Ignavibacteria bacterium]